MKELQSSFVQPKLMKKMMMMMEMMEVMMKIKMMIKIKMKKEKTQLEIQDDSKVY
jgi:hypothetical protein